MPPDIDLVKRFWDSPDEAYLTSPVVAAGRNCSVAQLERERWQKTGPKYVKINSRVLYRKSDVLAWIQQQTTECA
jgi:hypothetical protein